MISAKYEPREVKVIGDEPDILTEYGILTAALCDVCDRADVITNFMMGVNYKAMESMSDEEIALTMVEYRRQAREMVRNDSL